MLLTSALGEQLISVSTYLQSPFFILLILLTYTCMQTPTHTATHQSRNHASNSNRTSLKPTPRRKRDLSHTVREQANSAGQGKRGNEEQNISDSTVTSVGMSFYVS